MAKSMKAEEESRNVTTVDMPGYYRFWPLPGPSVSGFNKALANLGASETRVLRLSFPRDASVCLCGAADVERGKLTVYTATGSFEFLPESRFRVKDANGRETVSGILRGPTLEIGVHFGRAAAASNPASVGAPPYCAFGTGNIAVDPRGKELDFEATQQPLPYETTKSRGFVTFKVSTSSDFKGQIDSWGVPSPM